MPDDEGKKSVFNAGVAHAERIDMLQRIINSARFSPFQKDFETGKYNYEIILSANDGLMMESWSKMTTKEREAIERIRNLIHDFMNMNPIMKIIHGELKINKQNFCKFEELIDLYEKKNKDNLDAHNLNNPNYDDDDDY